MPDIYVNIASADAGVVEPLIEILELRASDPAQRAMRDTYFDDLDLPTAGRVVEVGCGPGPVARALAARPGVGEVIGIDPSPIFIDTARERAASLSNLSFTVGDARDLPLPDASFDAVVFHTTLCHVPSPERALAEARRVLRPGGRLAVFDGDYATVTCANSATDPLQTCLDAAVNELVHDRWLARRLSTLVVAGGFDPPRLRGHSYVEAPSSAGYMLRLIARGADALSASGRLSPTTASALQAEAQRRSDAGEFYGHINYVSAIAARP